MILRPRILFVVDAGPAVGGGHAMRSLSLARALQQHAADCAFLAPPATAAILDAFGPQVGRREAASTAPPDLARAMAGLEFDAVVFDHYGLAAEDHRAMAAGRPTLVIDDLADRPLAADLILDAGPARAARDYAELAAGARLLLGPAYAPLRPEFAALREAALARRVGPVHRLLVSLGMTDVGAISARVMDRLRRRAGDLAFDVVLGAEAPSRPGLTRIAGHDARVRVLVDAQDMADLTLNADAAIGAGGSAAWERCVLGLPSVLLMLADNQRPAARALAEAGAALVVDAADPDFDAAFDRAALRLLTDAETRRRLSAASSAICDGAGAERTAEAFLQLIAAPRGAQPA